MCKIYGQKWAIRNSNKTGTDYAVETNKITFCFLTATVVHCIFQIE